MGRSYDPYKSDFYRLACKNTTTLYAIVIIFNIILLLLFIYIYIYFLFQLIRPLLRYYNFKKGLFYEVRRAFGRDELLAGTSVKVLKVSIKNRFSASPS